MGHLAVELQVRRKILSKPPPPSHKKGGGRDIYKK